MMQTSGIFEVKRQTPRINDYHREQCFMDDEHLAFFSSVQKAFDFIETRIRNNYGNYNEYFITRIIIDDSNVAATWVEENRKRQMDRCATIQEGESNG